MTEKTPYKVGGRPVTVTVIGKKDCAKSFLRILAKGDIESYVAEITKECVVQAD